MGQIELRNTAVDQTVLVISKGQEESEELTGKAALQYFLSIFLSLFFKMWKLKRTPLYDIKNKNKNGHKLPVRLRGSK